MANALQSIYTQAGLALSPLSAVDTPEKAVVFFRQLGYEIPQGAFGTSLGQLATRGEELVRSVQQLTQASSEGETVAAIVSAGVQLSGAITALVDLHDQVKAGGAAALANIDELPQRLTDFLLLDAINRLNPAAHNFLHALGLIENEENPPAGQPMRSINWDRFGLAFSNPRELFEQTYDWSNNFDFAQFLDRVDGVMRAASLPGGLYPQPDATKLLLGNASNDLEELRFPIIHKGVNPESYAQFGLTFSPVEASGGARAGIAILPYLMGAAEFDFEVCDKGELVFESTGQIDGVGLRIRPPMDADGLMDLSGSFRAELTLRQKATAAPEILLLGTAGGTRLAVQGLGMSSFVQNDGSQTDIGWGGNIEALRIALTGGDGDGFLQNILSSVNLVADTQLGFGYSLRGGFYFTGGAKLAIDLPIHIDLGPLEVSGLRVEVEPQTDQLALQSGANIKLALGPLQAVVEDIGVEASFFFRQGNLGPLDLEFGFKPPSGVGLSVDAGVVKGGGYLYFDIDNEEYAGALELTFAEFLSLKAIGLITTKMPDGSKGFSMVIIITAEFTIQLGFGFVFLGAGGLLGLHRTMKLEPLAEGVRTGATSGIMFPTNVVENAPKIISDLKVFFPVEEGKFLIGPMAKLGWGTPTLISITMGIIIELRVDDGGGIERIAILGVLKCILPDEDAALLVLQVNFIGAIDFQKKNAFFFASMFESRVLFITIEGEMGVLVAWGDDSNFVVSVGGFHPRFNPPPLPFPVPKRVALNILNESWGKIRVEGYFAVTTNTVQLGCKLEVYFGFSEFKIEGHLAFDALFQFDPFYFIIEISGKVSLKVFGFDLFTISLKFSLEGTSPWRATGYGKVKILFFSFKAKFDKTWGESQNTKLPPISIIPILEAELQNIQNWQAIEPASTTGLFVTLREVPASDDSLALHPVGTLRISQRALPLEIQLDKFGSKKPDDANKLELEVSGSLQKITDVKESFARAQFQNMADSKKLSSPAYEKEVGGLELSVTGDQTRFGRTAVRHVRYELITIDTAYKRARKRFFSWSQQLFVHFFANSAIRRTTVSQRVKREFQPFVEKIDVRAGAYTVAFNRDNRPFSQEATNFESMARADEFINELIANDPQMADSVHTIPNNEVNLAQ